MPARLITLSLGIVLLGAIAAACGGGGDGEALTLEEYFQRLDVLVDSVAESSQSLGDDASADLDPSASLEEQIEASRSFLSAFAASIATFLDDIRDIDPPAEVEDAHDAFVEAAGDFVESSEDLIGQLDDVASLADFGVVFAAFDELGDPEEACLDLQAIADENSIAVDLNCELE